LVGHASEKMNKAIALLDEYEKAIGLPKHNPPGEEEELNEYFMWDRDIIESMSAENCASTAYRLAQFSFYFQRETNRETAREKWAKSQLDAAVALKLNDYDKYLKYEVKVALICKEDSYAQVLENIRLKAEQRTTRLMYLSSSIKTLSDTLMSVQRAKMAKKYEQ